MAAANDSQNYASLDFFRDSHKALYVRSVVSNKKCPVNITGWDAYEVVGLLKSIVNGHDYCMNSIFDFEIKNENAETKLFRLWAKPTSYQPGNGFISMPNRPGNGSYDQLTVSLKEEYEKDTQCFAEDIKKVFKDNKEIFNVPSVIALTYILLLFEIGRRLVNGSDSDLDKLPIASAIVRIVKLLEAGKCSFEDVFSREVELKFHVFTGNYDKRKKAIDNVKAAYQAEPFVVGTEQEELSLMFRRKPDDTDQIESMLQDLSLK